MHWKKRRELSLAINLFTFIPHNGISPKWYTKNNTATIAHLFCSANRKEACESLKRGVRVGGVKGYDVTGSACLARSVNGFLAPGKETDLLGPRNHTHREIN